MLRSFVTTISAHPEGSHGLKCCLKMTTASLLPYFARSLKLLILMIGEREMLLQKMTSSLSSLQGRLFSFCIIIRQCFMCIKRVKQGKPWADSEVGCFKSDQSECSILRGTGNVLLAEEPHSFYFWIIAWIGSKLKTSTFPLPTCSRLRMSEKCRLASIIIKGICQQCCCWKLMINENPYGNNQ